MLGWNCYFIPLEDANHRERTLRRWHCEPCCTIWICNAGNAGELLLQRKHCILQSDIGRICLEPFENIQSLRLIDAPRRNPYNSSIFWRDSSSCFFLSVLFQTPHFCCCVGWLFRRGLRWSSILLVACDLELQWIFISVFHICTSPIFF